MNNKVYLEYNEKATSHRSKYQVQMYSDQLYTATTIESCPFYLISPPG